MTVPIAELVDACEGLAAHNRFLFESLGGWVADEPDGRVQRWWSAAAHRHAWHAELWAARRPAVPLDTEVRGPPAEPPADADRVAWYLAELEQLSNAAATLGAQVDPDLDPGTARVVRLITADLDELAATAP